MGHKLQRCIVHISGCEIKIARVVEKRRHQRKEEEREGGRLTDCSVRLLYSDATVH